MKQSNTEYLNQHQYMKQSNTKYLNQHLNMKQSNTEYLDYQHIYAFSVVRDICL